MEEKQDTQVVVETNKVTDNDLPVASDVQKTPEVVEKPVVPEIKTSDDPEAGKVDPLLDGHYKTNPFFYEVADYFNLKTEDHHEAAPKLAAIVDWIMEKFDVSKPEDILMKLREGEDMVQRPGWDEKRYTNLFKYARLDAKKTSISKAMSAFRRNPNER